MVAYEAPTDNPEDVLPVGGVLDSGSLLSVVGPGNGTQQAFEGLTTSNGLDDHPNAQTNANWQVLFDYTVSFSSAPECGKGSQTQFVPTGGAEFDETCLL